MKKTFDIDDDLLKKTEEDQKHKNIATATQYLDEALKHFLSCKNAESAQSLKLIILRYPTTCLRCKRKIDSGEYALYGRGVGAVCLDCHIERVGDRTTIAKYLRNRELDKVHHALSNECEGLAGRLELYRTIDKLDSLINKRQEIDDLINKYLREGLASAEEQEILLGMKENRMDIERLAEEVRQWIKRYMQTSKKKWKKREEQEEENR